MGGVASAGPTRRRVVLVHGFTQSAQSWRRVADRLEPRYDVVAVDLPGHGSASAVRVADLSGAAAFVGEAGGRATYVGYSLGGRCCLTLALEHPDLVEQLVLVGATPGIADADERAARRRADDTLADSLDPGSGSGSGSGSGVARATPDLQTFLDHWLAGPLFAHLNSEQADIDARLVNTLAGLASSLRSTGAGTQVPSWSRLGELSMPVWLVTGEHDEKFGAVATAMAAKIGARARHVVIPGSGHAVPFEAPSAFATLIGELLAHRS